ncbi:MAG: TonB-dependent receptor plug domain-containing protein, partial [bacterium]
SLSSRVVNLAFKGDIRYKIGGGSWLKWGLSATNIPSRINFESSRENFLYARVETPNAIGFDQSYRYYATYLESSSKALDNLHCRIGVRYDYSTLIDDGELSPRFNVWYRLTDHLTIEGSWGLFYQFPNPISVYTRNIPVDLSTNLDIISAEKATHQILGVERTFGDKFSAKLQLYDKELDRLLLPIDEQTFAPTNGGSGFSRGLELVFEKKPESNSRFSGVLSYAFAKAKFHFSGSNTWLPFKYDRRHTFSLLSNIRISSRWQLSIAGQYSSGLPFTDVLGLRNNLDPGGAVSFDFVRGGRFERRLPAFKKIDARLSYQRTLGGKGFSFYLDVVNITNQKNVQEITWERRYLPDNQQQATKRMIYMLPILPSIGVSIKM